MKMLDMFPCTAGVDLFPCCVDIHGIVSTHVETVCLLSNRKPDTTVKLSVDMDDYYRIKDGKEPK